MRVSLPGLRECLSSQTTTYCKYHGNNVEFSQVKDVGVFSHLLKGLRMGCPPHGGIALGKHTLHIMCF